MMGIRAKLLLPLLAQVVVIFGVVEFYLWPSLADREQTQYVTYQKNQLHVIKIALVDLLFNDNLAELHQFLDEVHARNPEWLRLELIATEGHRIYPVELPDTEFGNNPNLLHYHEKITYVGNHIASLFVTIDLENHIAQLQSQLRVLDWLVLFLLPATVFASAIMQDRLVRRPLSKLADAATRISDGDFVVDLPKQRNDEVGKLVRAFADMCEIRQSAENALEELAYHDVLTGLPNRSLFKEELRKSLERAERLGNSVSLLFLDLDRFKIVNDTLGHEVGDRLLVEAAKRIQNVLRQGTLIARLGGDEFTIVLPEQGVDSVARVVAKRIIKTLEKPFDFDGHSAVISPSIGISEFPKDAQDPISMVQCADTAMYEAKEAGGNRLVFYSSSMGDKLSRSLDLEAGLRRAIKEEEFILHYQPKIELSTGRIIGAEALIRWIDPEQGMIPPNDFIPLAEETGLIVPIGIWVLKKSIEQRAQWDAPEMSLAINLSASHLSHSQLIPTLQNTVNEAGIPPHLLELEITENAFMQNVQQTTKVLEQIKSLGIKVAIDDFGTGYSSLSYLKYFDIDTIKIDRSFVKDTPDNTVDVAIATATIALAKSMQRQVVAEGIETREQAELFNSLGCEMGQGYYYGKPVESEVFSNMLHQTRYLPASRKLPQVINF